MVDKLGQQMFPLDKAPAPDVRLRLLSRFLPLLKDA